MTNASSGASVSLTNHVQSRRASRRAVSGWNGQRVNQIEAVLHAARPAAPESGSRLLAPRE